VKVLLAGTGGAVGAPVPGCRCVACARPSPTRRPLEIVLDGVVRLVPGTPLPRAYHVTATRYGTRITGSDGHDVLFHAGLPAPVRPPGARAVAHPDRSADGPGDTTKPGAHDVLGPPGPGAPGEPGSGHLVVTGAAGPDGPLGPPCRLVLVDPFTRPAALGELRRAGLVGAHTDVVAVGIDHQVPSEAELARRLGLWGARAVPDGTELDTTAPVPPRCDPPRRTLLLGGSRSGKSAEAELRLAAEPEVTYVATGPSGRDDPEWRARIARHRDRRPAHWDTVETTDLTGALRTARTPLLVDGIGTWLTAVLDECGAWEPREGAWERVGERCAELVAAWRQVAARVVVVSDEVGLGVVPATAAGRRFRDAIGALNQRLAAESEEVALVVAGRLLPL
jgi:adenosylcobinamide kinase/adenosylcobinamide-phosphate guanylyltransferase